MVLVVFMFMFMFMFTFVVMLCSVFDHNGKFSLLGVAVVASVASASSLTIEEWLRTLIFTVLASVHENYRMAITRRQSSTAISIHLFRPKKILKIPITLRVYHHAL